MSEPLQAGQQINPGEKRFSTADILLYLSKLLTKNIKQVDKEAQFLVTKVGSALAQARNDLYNPVPVLIENLQAHLGAKTKTQPNLFLLHTHLETFASNFLPGMVVQQENLQKALGLLKNKYEILTKAKSGDASTLAELETIDKELKKLVEKDLKAYKGLVDESLEQLDPTKNAIEKASGRKLPKSNPEEALAPKDLQSPSPENPSGPSSKH